MTNTCAKVLLNGFIVLLAVGVIFYKYWVYVTNPWRRDAQVYRHRSNHSRAPVRRATRWMLVAILFQWSWTSAVLAVELAITVDDVPQYNFGLRKPADLTWREINETMLDAFAAHNVRGAYAFVNADKLVNSPENTVILQRWIDRGQFIGNHTYSHMGLSRNSAEKFIEDIRRNDQVLEKFKERATAKVFHYPYLEEGDTLAKRDAVRDYLLSNGYLLAAPTVDFGDFRWSDPYIRCLANGTAEDIAWLRESFITKALKQLDWVHERLQALYGREIKHVLLVHINSFSALMMDDLLSALEEKGVRFITVEEALTDPIYSYDPGQVFEHGLDFIQQLDDELDPADFEIESRKGPSKIKQELTKICT